MVKGQGFQNKGRVQNLYDFEGAAQWSAFFYLVESHHHLGYRKQLLELFEALVPVWETSLGGGHT